jgi:OOP family OmpA-OmpF porin
MRSSALVGFVVAAFGVLPGAGCAQVSTIRGDIDSLRKLTDTAESNGAMRCAPRELAMARAHLRFAEVELGQGQFLHAQTHMAIAHENANAANELSPAATCAARDFVEELPGDRDGDGLFDPVDKCIDQPETYNGLDDDDGCPDEGDIDGDGLADSKDVCPLAAEDKDGFLDDDGCPELDNDLDGIADASDKDASGKSCANDPEDPDGFEDTDGCPEPDNDGDTVADLTDQCPNEKGEVGGDKPGCPKKPSLVVVTDKEIRITQQIHFEFDKAVIRPDSFPILDAVADVLKQNPKIRLEIQGHTDNKGNPSYNKTLSDKRAASVLKYLTGKGIDKSRLSSKGYGMERPIVPNNSDQNRALNRRVQFIRVEGGAAP